MAVNPSPFGPKPAFFDAAGAPDNTYKLFTYIAGSNTKQNTYTSSTGSVANSNPIILNTLGMTPNEFWFTASALYKVVLAPSTDTDPPSSPIWTIDNLRGINDPVATVTQDEWVQYGAAATYVSATSFTVAGNATTTFQIGRRIKTTNSGGTIYSTITNSVFGALTTVTVVNDSGVLDSGLSVAYYGLLSITNPSIPSRLATTSSLTMNTARVLGRTTAATGAIEELTSAQIAAFTDAATTTAQGVSELATAAETQTGSDATRTVTPAGLKGALLFSKSFLSSDQTVTVNSTLNVAHSLGTKPVYVRVTLKCTTAELNYAVNDEIEYNQFTYSGVGYTQIASDATNVTIVITGANLGVLNKTTQTMTSITTASWKWVVRAWA